MGFQDIRSGKVREQESVALLYMNKRVTFNGCKRRSHRYIRELTEMRGIFYINPELQKIIIMIDMAAEALEVKCLAAYQVGYTGLRA